MTEFLKATNRFDKTIVFCEDIDHAERMRQALVNENADLVAQNRKYIMRITGDDAEGKAELDNFILPESRYPVITTTSKLMNTGVDAQTCKPIVLDQRIQSMTVFKQIIGRGTRINEEFVVSDVPVKVVAERVQYYDKEGKLITESLKDYTRATVCKGFSSLDSFLNRWSKAEKKNLIIQELEGQGLLLHALEEEVGRDFDPFDLICHVVYDQPPLSRKERAEAVRKRNYFAKYGEKARAVLNALLDKYADEGIENIESMEVLKVQPLDRFGTPLEIINIFGGKDKYLAALRGLETQIYMAEA